MKNKKLLGIISAVLAIAIATTVAVALLSVTKQTSTISVQTASMDMTLGTPSVSGGSLYPGQVFTVDVPVTNTNNFAVVSTNATLQNVTWYDGTTQIPNAVSNLTVNSTSMLKDSSTSTQTFGPGAQGIVRVVLTYSSSADPSYVGKNVKFNLDIPFNQY